MTRAGPDPHNAPDALLAHSAGGRLPSGKKRSRLCFACNSRACASTSAYCLVAVLFLDLIEGLTEPPQLLDSVVVRIIEQAKLARFLV